MIEPGQIYRSVRSGTRIKIVGRPLPGAWGAGKANVVTLTEDGRELRFRTIGATQLHEDLLTIHGKPRRNGYVLEVEL